MMPGCDDGVSSPDTTGPCTDEVISQPGDNTTLISGLLVRLTLDDLVKGSHAILIGEVVEILPAKWGTGAPERPIIYTDVIIQPERYLYGTAESGNVAIWLRGGRVGNDVTISGNEAVFCVGEKVLVFLFYPPNLNTYQLPQAPEGINPLNYYMVTGSLMGKWKYADGKAFDFENNKVSVSKIERTIEKIHGSTLAWILDWPHWYLLVIGVAVLIYIYIRHRRQVT